MDDDGKWPTADKARLKVIVEWLITDHLSVLGGYPYDYVWVGDTLVIAGLDDGKERHATSIDTYKRAKLLAWCRRAEKFSRTHAGYGLSGCLQETWLR